jgi:hypothetical protein
MPEFWSSLADRGLPQQYRQLGDVGGDAPGLSPICPPQQRGELGNVRRESMPSSLCALANKFEHLTSFELFVFTFRERQIPRIAGIAIDAAHDADVTGGCTFHAE